MVELVLRFLLRAGHASHWHGLICTTMMHQWVGAYREAGGRLGDRVHTKCEDKQLCEKLCGSRHFVESYVIPGSHYSFETCGNLASNPPLPRDLQNRTFNVVVLEEAPWVFKDEEGIGTLDIYCLL